MASPEQQPQGPEKTIETPTVSAEQYERLIDAGAELGVETNSKETVEKATTEAKEKALSVERGSAERAPRPRNSPPAKRKGAISKKDREASFKKHMQQVQSELSGPSRAFSKVIHNKAVEKVSEAVGSTVARPNAILAGAISAFVLVLATYLIAKNLGYVLSGFETIGAFIAGWIIGIVYDYLRVLVTGKKS